MTLQFMPLCVSTYTSNTEEFRAAWAVNKAYERTRRGACQPQIDRLEQKPTLDLHSTAVPQRQGSSK